MRNLPFPTLPCPALLVIPLWLAGSMSCERCLDKPNPAYQQRAGYFYLLLLRPESVHRGVAFAVYRSGYVMTKVHA